VNIFASAGSSLTWKHFPAGEHGFFRAPVLVAGKTEAALIDGGFTLADGRALAEAIVAVARERGHRTIRLDTLPSMASAIALYEDLGFERIDPYYAPTPPGTVFMALDLVPASAAPD